MKKKQREKLKLETELVSLLEMFSSWIFVLVSKFSFEMKDSHFDKQQIDATNWFYNV